MFNDPYGEEVFMAHLNSYYSQRMDVNPSDFRCTKESECRSSLASCWHCPYNVALNFDKK